MPLIIDANNAVSSKDTAPDGLRAEIGTYFSTEPQSTSRVNFVNFSDMIAKSYIHDHMDISDVLIPTKKSTIVFSGRESAFRDHMQWNEYVASIISEGSTFSDHQFNIEIPTIESEFKKNYHHPIYEDFTKSFNSNMLLNYNLISYPHKDKSETVSRLADIKTSFDTSSGFSIRNRQNLEQAMEQFSNRVLNFSGSANELSTKQRNIFDLILGPPRTVTNNAFPFYYKKELPIIGQNGPGFELKRIMNLHGKTKNIFQSIKRDLSFQNISFNIGQQSRQFKVYDFLTFITSSPIVSIQEGSDETFLVPENQIGFGTKFQRFAESVSAARFLSDMRKFIHSNSRNLSEILNSTSSKTMFLGYRIEKYLDNDATQPIQTYYTNDRTFIDTQLKYGRKYIYKTKMLVAVLGSSYSYSNLFVSQEDGSIINSSGETPVFSPRDYGNVRTEKYVGFVDVETKPSFKIVEYQIDEHEVAFMDAPTLPPQVEIFNDKKEQAVQFRFSPNFFKIESVSAGNNSELMRDLSPLTNNDRRVVELLRISGNSSVNPDYFTGIYEVYRTKTPPRTEKDFSEKYLTTVDDQSGMFFPLSMNRAPSTLDNMNGYFKDKLIPNQKYYYAFRALTYHSTPSNLTIPYEIELQQDSDEFKVNVSQYKYPNDNKFVYQKTAKRIMKITPNIERLLFSSEEDRNDWKLDNGSLLTVEQSRSFKIRVTSKHTGKKIDININFKLTKDDSFNEN